MIVLNCSILITVTSLELSGLTPPLAILFSHVSFKHSVRASKFQCVCVCEKVSPRVSAGSSRGLLIDWPTCGMSPSAALPE